jgi:hypothetical protein
MARSSLLRLLLLREYFPELLPSPTTMMRQSFNTVIPVRTQTPVDSLFLSLPFPFPPYSPHPTLCWQFLTSVAVRWLDGKHVVFGEVLEGMEVVKAIEAVETSYGDKPKAEVKIAKSGELEVPAEGIHKEL